MRNLIQSLPILLVLMGCASPSVSPLEPVRLTRTVKEHWLLRFDRTLMATTYSDPDLVAAAALAQVRVLYMPYLIDFGREWIDEASLPAGMWDVNVVEIVEADGPTAAMGIWGMAPLDEWNRQKDYIGGGLFGVFPNVIEPYFRERMPLASLEQSGRMLGDVIAHEIGHALGMRHMQPYPAKPMVMWPGGIPLHPLTGELIDPVWSIEHQAYLEKVLGLK